MLGISVVVFAVVAAASPDVPVDAPPAPPVEALPVMEPPPPVDTAPVEPPGRVEPPLSSSAGPVRIGLAVQPPVGLTEAEAKTLADRLRAELQLLGLVVVDQSEVDPACVADAACVETTRASASEPLPALLVVELLRIGPVVQLTTTGAAGDARVSGSHELNDAQVAGASLLPDDVVAWARGLIPKAAPPPPPPPPPPPRTLSFMQGSGLVTAGVGALATLTGLVLVGAAEGVLEDKTSSSAAKDQAITLGWVGIASTTIGVAAVGAGAALFFLVE